MKAPTTEEAFELRKADPLFPQGSETGMAGKRLRARLGADIFDDLLREFARDTLRAQRCSAKYLDALRIILGNMADAERKGYALELNVRAAFASPDVMRTILAQLKAANITRGRTIGLGPGRRQTVQVFGHTRHLRRMRTDGTNPDEIRESHGKAERALSEQDRRHEQDSNTRRAMRAAVGKLREMPCPLGQACKAYFYCPGTHPPPTNITEADVPF